MKFKKTIQSVILTLLFAYQTSGFCQSSQSNLFIEPNVALKYDNSSLKVTDRFSNSYYGTEAYSLNYLKKDGSKSYIYIEAKNSTTTPDQNYQDSILDISIEYLNSIKSDSISVYKKAKTINYKEFSGYSVVFKYEKENKYATAFYCYKYFDGGICVISYLSAAAAKVDSYKSEYSILTSLIDGLITYSKKDLEILNSEEKQISDKIKIIVDSIPRPADFHFEATFLGNVTIIDESKSEIKHLEVQGEYYPQIVEKDSLGKFFIYFNDKQKGFIEKEGILIIKDKIGRKVTVPFKFSYYNL